MLRHPGSEVVTGHTLTCNVKPGYSVSQTRAVLNPFLRWSILMQSDSVPGKEREARNHP